MSTEIIVASDTHGRGDLLRELERAYPRADLFLHCGDLEESPSSTRAGSLCGATTTTMLLRMKCPIPVYCGSTDMVF